MPEYAWMCRYKHYYKYALGPKYEEILNMAKFWISQDMPWPSYEHILGSTYVRILNMEGFWISKSYTEF